MRWVQNTGVELFRLTFSTGRFSRKSGDFSTGSASKKTQRKKIDFKKTFLDCVRKPNLGSSRKRPFSTEKSNCVRNGLYFLRILKTTKIIARNKDH